MNNIASLIAKAIYESEFSSGLLFSILFHIVIASVAIVGLPALKRDFNVVPDVIPVEFVNIDDLTRSVERPKLQPAEELEPTPQSLEQRQEVENTVPDAVPTLEAAKDRTPIDETLNQPARPMPNVTPRTKPRPPSALDTSRIAALIDRSKQEQEAQVPTPTQEDNSQKLEDAVERLQMSQMEARRATITIQALILSKVESCWSIPAGAKDADDLRVSIKISLRPDGSLAKVPEYMDTSRMSDPFYRAAAESAVRAVRRCAPYDLPRDQYSLWRELIFNFDPKELLDG